MARRNRTDRRTAGNSGAVASPHVKRRLPYFNPLDDAELQQIEDHVDWMIENVGVAFRDDPVALDIWRKAGITPGGEHGDLIKADAQWIRSLVAKAPQSFTQVARNPERSVTIGSGNQIFAPIYGAPFVRDLEGGRRYATFADFENW